MRLEQFFKDNPEVKKQYDTAKKELKTLNDKYHKELDKHNENNDDADTWDEGTYEQTKETLELKEKIDQLEKEIRSIELQGNERKVVGEKIRGDVQKAKETGSTFAVADANKNIKQSLDMGKKL